MPTVIVTKTTTRVVNVVAKGPQGLPGADGTNGTDGAGLTTGGVKGQITEKLSGTDFDTRWQYRAREVAHQITGTTVDDKNGGYQVISLAGNTTLDFSLTVEAEQATGVYVDITTNGFSLIWSNVAKWKNGIPTTIGDRAAFAFWKDWNSNEIIGEYLGDIA
jgi:hypothetical protein